MMLPNKTIPYNESVIAKFPTVLHFMQRHGAVKPTVLYESLKKAFSSIHVFVQTLDCLFALRKIKFAENTGELVLC